MLVLSEKSTRSVTRLLSALAVTAPAGETHEEWALGQRARTMLRLLREMA